MPDRKVLLLLKMMQSAKGHIDASDNAHSLLNYFCDDRGRKTDTFNLAIKGGLIRTTFHDLSERSEAFLTERGKSALKTAHGTQPDEPSEVAVRRDRGDWRD